VLLDKSHFLKNLSLKILTVAFRFQCCPFQIKNFPRKLFGRNRLIKSAPWPRSSRAAACRPRKRPASEWSRPSWWSCSTASTRSTRRTSPDRRLSPGVEFMNEFRP
jgi:hypothetical protein